jgi:hypothetical protein
MWGKRGRRADQRAICGGCQSAVEPRAAYRLARTGMVLCSRCFLTHDYRGNAKDSCAAERSTLSAPQSAERGSLAS